MKNAAKRMRFECIKLLFLLCIVGCGDSSHVHEHVSNNSTVHGEHVHDHDAPKQVHSDHGIKNVTTISNEIAARSGIKTLPVESRTISEHITLRGKVTPSEHKIAHIIPRFSGVVKEGRKHIGDRVSKGEVLAILESNQSLQPFSVSSQIEGVVVKGHVIVGEYVPENQWIYIVSDISELWVDLHASSQDSGRLKEGLTTTIASVHGEGKATGLISYIAPYFDERSQTRIVRIVFKNLDMKFLPGMHVTGEVLVNTKTAHMAVKKSALQNYEQSIVVFVKSKNTYTAAPVTLGVEDGEWIEVLEGLQTGDEVVTENSFLIKADMSRASASHSH